MTKAHNHINSLECNIKVKEENLEKAEEKISNLEANKVSIENKLKIYSATLRKLIKEKEANEERKQ